jgi:hypothetical protein
MVAPERQRRGLGEELFRTWDRSVGAALGLGLSGASSALLKKMHFPDVAAIPGVVKPLTRRAVRMPQWPMTLNRIVSAVTLPIVRVAARVRPLRADVEPNPPVRRVVHGPLGKARRSFRARRPPRCRVPELEVHRADRTCGTRLRRSSATVA